MFHNYIGSVTFVDDVNIQGNLSVDGLVNNRSLSEHYNDAVFKDSDEGKTLMDKVVGCTPVNTLPILSRVKQGFKITISWLN